MKIIFWLSAFLIVYNYVLYPLLVIGVSKLSRYHKNGTPSSLLQQDNLPTVSLIIAAYNEEKVIVEKIENSLNLQYPGGKLQILVVSDGSDDRTPAIVQQYNNRGVLSLHQPARRGKTAALNRGVAEATGEIIVFSDANNEFSEDAIVQLTKHFVQPNIGGVCGLKSIKEAKGRESSEGDSLYWLYESAIKKAESAIGSITAADGEIFAIRSCLYEPISEHIINDDAEITFLLVSKGCRIIYEPLAISSEYASIDIVDDYYVKVRMVAGGFQTIREHWRELFPVKNRFSAMFISHKLLRWLVPELLLIVLLVAFVLSHQPTYKVLLVLQLVFYCLAAVGWVMRKQSTLPTLLYVPFYFVVMNAAALQGLFRFLFANQSTSWRKAQR